LPHFLVTNDAKINSDLDSSGVVESSTAYS